MSAAVALKQSGGRKLTPAVQRNKIGVFPCFFFFYWYSLDGTFSWSHSCAFACVNVGGSKSAGGRGSSEARFREEFQTRPTSSSCILMKTLIQLLLVHRVAVELNFFCWPCRLSLSIRRWARQLNRQLFSILRLEVTVHLLAPSNPPETDSPQSIYICSIQFPFGSWLTRWPPPHPSSAMIAK